MTEIKAIKHTNIMGIEPQPCTHTL